MTSLTNSPAQTRHGSEVGGLFDGSPSKRREKSKSQSNLDRHIQDVAKLELELNKVPVSLSPRLSTVFDRSLFVAPPLSPRLTEDPTPTPEANHGRSIQFNDLNPSSYHHVEPYPLCKSSDQVVLESPDRRHLEGVYDRFLTAASGVKRVGKGYQSNNPKPLQNAAMNTTEQTKGSNTRGFSVFGSNKRAMPPPISSEDAWTRSTSFDELGFIATALGPNTSSRTCKDENKRTFVRRAIKAMVPGRTTTRRLSRPIVV